VIRSLGAVNALVVTDTDPEVMVPEPRESDPLLNAIVPVTPEGTDAVIVTDWPYVLGVGLVVTVTVVFALLTTWRRIEDELELNFAVILWVPAVRLEVTIVAVVPEIGLLPMLVVPSKKVTVPVFPGAKVAVKVTACV
jgi:hypothetical protein